MDLKLFDNNFNNLKSLKNKPSYKARQLLAGRKICILGLGIENQALVKFLLAKKINCEITICDKKKTRTQNFAFLPKKINWRLGKNYDYNLAEFDIIFRSPGHPLFSRQIKKAKQSGVDISSPMKLFFQLCPTKNIIGVTGTKGKGTTASLIHKILKTAGKRAWLGGNIGIAPFSFINKIKKDDWVILELSSFQLEDMEVSPKIAVITNFTSEHLAPADPNNPNFHRSLANYWQAKANIFKHQKRGGYLILNFKFLISKQFLIFNFQTKGKKIFFKKSELPSKLVGDYNKENIAAAIEVAKIIKIKKSVIEKTVKNFKGLPHRIEYVATKKGVHYYDNSFATTPDSTIMDLDIFEPLVLVAGGADKGANFKNLAKKIKSRVKFLILLDGKGTKKIIKELNLIKFSKNKIEVVEGMKEAIKISRLHSKKDDTVLLSPACASFGMFKNYKERGKMFKEEVNRQNR